MKLRKRFDSFIEKSPNHLGKEKYATIELIERKNEKVDLIVRNFVKKLDSDGNVIDTNRSPQNPEPVYRLRFESDKPLRKMSNVISRFLSSKTKPAFTEKFSNIEYELRESAYNPDKELNNGSTAENFFFTIDEHLNRYVMWFSLHGGKEEVEFNISTSKNADGNHDNLIDFLGFIQDFTQKGIFWDEKISWENLPEDLQNAKTRVESAEEKLFNSNSKGAAVELRDCFHGLESVQKDLENIDKRKTKEIMRSGNNIKDFALHTEQRDETLEVEDVELILGNFNNIVNYFAKVFEKQRN